MSTSNCDSTGQISRVKDSTLGLMTQIFASFYAITEADTMALNRRLIQSPCRLGKAGLAS